MRLLLLHEGSSRQYEALCVTETELVIPSSAADVSITDCCDRDAFYEKADQTKQSKDNSEIKLE